MIKENSLAHQYAEERASQRSAIGSLILLLIVYFDDCDQQGCCFARKFSPQLFLAQLSGNVC